MTEEKKQSFLMGISMLKIIMQEEGLAFGIVVDKKDPDNSRLAAITKESVRSSKYDGVQLSLTELNRDLL